MLEDISEDSGIDVTLFHKGAVIGLHQAPWTFCDWSDPILRTISSCALLFHHLLWNKRRPTQGDIDEISQ